MKSIVYFILLSVVCSIPFVCFSQSDAETADILDDYVISAMKDWEVPGLALTVVKDNEIVFSRGYGLTELGKPGTVNNKTLFAAASTTKAFTAAALGILVDQKKIKWDDPVIKHLPEFKLNDPWVTQELSIRDLLTHRAGLGNTDLLWMVNYPTEEILYRMRYAEPAYSMRSGFIYQNIMYAVAGEVIARVSGSSWEDFLKEHILTPLKMDRTILLAKQLKGKDNYASPHYRINGRIEPIEMEYADPIAPAGAMWSCVDDMAKWMMFLLDSGKINNVQLLQKETYSELFTPQVIIPQSNFYPAALLTRPHWTTYSLGWFQHDYKGRALDFHTGSLDGLVAIIGLVPGEKFGIYLFGNLDHAELRHAIMYKTIDLYLDNDNSHDWHKEIFELYEGFRMKSEMEKKKLTEERIPETNTTLHPEGYEGIFSDPLWGEIEIKREENRLTLSYNSYLKGNLKHWHYDTFEVIWNKKQMGNNLLTFGFDNKGKVAEIRIFSHVFKKRKD